MKGNMIRQAALDLVLRNVRAGVTGVALADEIPRVYACDGAADPPRFRVPTDVIADLKACRHDQRPQCRNISAIFAACAETGLMSLFNLAPNDIQN